MNTKLLFWNSIFILFSISLFGQSTVYQSSIDENLSSPVRMAIDNSDNIYVTDGYQHCIVKYDSSGNFVERIFVENNPVSIAINQNDEIFVGDGNSGNIFKITSGGSQSLFFSGLSLPNSMTFSPEGNLYISDGELHTVFVLDVSGNLIQTIGQSNLIFPTSVVYDQTNSRILVSEHGGIGTGFSPTCKIWIFDLNGTLQGSFASNGYTDGKFYRIQGMTIGKCGNLYVCDPFQGNISVFDRNNIFLYRFGQFGTQTGQLNLPMDILFDSQQRVIIASMNNGKLEVFNITDSLPTSNIINSNAQICNGDTTNIKVAFTGTSPWTFTYTVDGLDSTTITTANNPYFLPVNQSGIYEVVALSDSDRTGTCFSGSALIAISDSIPTSQIPTDTVAVCDGSSIDIPVTFTGTGPWTFTYTVDSLNPTTISTTDNPYILSTTQAGLYEVTEVSTGNCVGNNNGAALVNITPLPSSALLDTTASLCAGSTVDIPVEFSGIGPWTFTYTIDSVNPITISTYNNPYTIVASSGGTYQITDVATNGCTGSDMGISAVVNESLYPVSQYTYSTNNLEVSFTNSSVNAISYIWDFGDGQYSTDINPTHIYSSPGTYTVSLTASNGVCGDNILNQTVTLINTGLNNMGNTEDVELFPNPTDGIINLKFTSVQKNISILIFNSLGQTVINDSYSTSDLINKIDLNSLTNGIYTIQIVSNKISKTYRVALEK